MTLPRTSPEPTGHRGHIAMFSIPAHGHVNPGLPVIAELVRRGWRVSYANTEDFRTAIEATGATLVPYQTTLPFHENPEKWADDMPSAVAAFLYEAIAVLPQLEKAYTEDRPDLVLYDIGAYCAPVLAHRWDLPIVQLSPTFVGWDGYEEDMAEHLEPMRSALTERGYYADFEAWLAGNGIDTPVDHFVGRPRRCVAMVAPSIQPHREKVNDNYRLVGPCIGDRSHQGSWQRPPGNRPVLLVSLGSAATNQPGFFADCVRAFGDTDWQVVMSIGQHVDPADLGEVPANIEVHRWVPQLAVLAQLSTSDAFVTHAGMGGTSEGLVSGVPMVAVPQMTDGFSNAAQIEALGVGRQLLMEQVTPEALWAAVTEVSTDPAVAERCRQVQHELRESGGTDRAVELVEGYLRDRSW